MSKLVYIGLITATCAILVRINQTHAEPKSSPDVAQAYHDISTDEEPNNNVASKTEKRQILYDSATIRASCRCNNREIYVCGRDGKIYSNYCKLWCAGSYAAIARTDNLKFCRVVKNGNDFIDDMHEDQGRETATDCVKKCFNYPRDLVFNQKCVLQYNRCVLSCLGDSIKDGEDCNYPALETKAGLIV